MKNAIAFYLDLQGHGLVELDQAFRELPYKPMAELGDQDDEDKATMITFTSGFCPVFDDDDKALFVEKLANGFVFSVKLEEKVLPASAVDVAVKKAVDDMKRRGRDDLSSGELTALRDGIKQQLLSRALSKVTKINAFYHVESQFLIVPEHAAVMARCVANLLKKTRLQLNPSQITKDVKKGLTTGLSAWLDESTGVSLLGDTRPFGRFDVSCDVTMRGDGRSITLQANRKNEETVEQFHSSIRDALKMKMEVESLRLEYGVVPFTLKKDLRLSGVKMPKGDSSDSSAGGIDVFEAQLFEWAGNLHIVVAIYRDLCGLFGWTAPASGDQPNE